MKPKKVEDAMKRRQKTSKVRRRIRRQHDEMPLATAPQLQTIAPESQTMQHTAMAAIPMRNSVMLARGKGQKRHSALVAKLYGSASDDEKRMLKALSTTTGSKRYYRLMDAILRMRANMELSDIVNFAAVNGFRLFDIIDAFPSPEAKATLRSALTNGKLSALDEIKISLGLATNVKGALKSPFLKPGNMDHVATLLNDTDWNAEPAEDRAELIATDNNRIRDAIYKQSQRLYAYYRAVRRKYSNQDQQDDAEKRLIKVDELYAKLRQRMKLKMFKNHLDKQGMIDDIREWIGKVDAQTAATALMEKSSVIRVLLLAKQIYKLPQRDFDTMIAMLRDAAVLEAGRVTLDNGTGVELAESLGIAAIRERLFPEEDARLLEQAGSMRERHKALSDKDELTSEERREKGQLAKKLNKIDTLNQVSQFGRMLEREWVKHEQKKKRFRVHHRRLKAYVDGMSDEARYMFIKSLIKPEDLATAMSTGDPSAFQSEFEKAKEKFAGFLDRAGLSERAKAVILARFELKGSMDENYRRLIKTVYDYDHKVIHRTKTQHAHKVMDLLSKMRGDEFRQLRSNTKLLADLGRQLSDKYRNRAAALIGVSLDGAGLDAGTTPEEQSKKASGDAEQNATRWAEVIHQYVKGHRFRNIQKVYGIVYEAQQEASSSGAFKLSDIYKQLYDNHYSSLEWISLNAHGMTLVKKMSKNEPITVQDRLKLARRGIKTRSSEIELILDQTTDEDVLMQWSNFPEFQQLWHDKQQYMIAITNTPSQDDKDTLQLQLDQINRNIDNFVIDIDNKAYDLVHAELASKLGKSERLGKMEAKIRKRIADAMAKSTSFKALVESTGYTEKDVEMLGQQVQALSAIRLEDLSRKGIEWTSVSSLAVGRRVKFAQLITGHRRLRKNVEKVHNRGGSDGQFLAVTGSSMSDQLKKDRSTAIDSELGHVKKQQKQYESIRSAFEAARSKYNNRVLKVVGIILAIAAAAVTGGLSAAGSIGAGALLGLINAATTIASKLIETGVKAILQGGLDMTGPEIAQDIVNEMFGAGLAAATGALSFQFNDTFLKGLKDSSALMDKVAAKLIDKAINNAIKDASSELFKGFTSGILTEQSSLRKWADGPGKMIADKMVKHVTEAGLVFLQTTTSQGLSSPLMDAFGESKHKSTSIAYQGPHGTNFVTKTLEIIEKEIYNPTIGAAVNAVPIVDPYKAGKITPGALDAKVEYRMTQFEQTLWKARVIKQAVETKKTALSQAIDEAPTGNETQLGKPRRSLEALNGYLNGMLATALSKGENALDLLYHHAEQGKLKEEHADGILTAIGAIDRVVERGFAYIREADEDIEAISRLEAHDGDVALPDVSITPVKNGRKTSKRRSRRAVTN